MMTRLLLCAALALAALLLAPVRADAGNVLTTINTTDRSTWITVYYRDFRPLNPAEWQIGRAFCVTGDKTHTEHLTSSIMTETKLKVRAEAKIRADCGGPTLSDTYDVMDYGSKSSWFAAKATLREHGNTGHYYILLSR
jgi:hypothetical protein